MQEFSIVVEKCPRTGLYAGHVPGFASAHATGKTMEELYSNLQKMVANMGPRRMSSRRVINNAQHIEKMLGKMGKVRKSSEYDADFIVTPNDGGEDFKVQVWGSMVFSERNRGARNIRIAICVGEEVYCYPHDKVLAAADQKGVVCNSPSWQLMGHYTVSSKDCTKSSWAKLLAPHKL